MIALGFKSKGQWLASIALMDSPECRKAYFQTVLDTTYTGPVYVYPQGANPSGNLRRR